MPGWMALPREWLGSLGDIARFGGRVMGIVYSGRVFRFFGESLRQAGILILGSTIVIWGLVFILGLQCGIEGAYFSRSVGAPAHAGTFAAWCDLRVENVSYGSGDYITTPRVCRGKKSDPHWTTRVSFTYADGVTQTVPSHTPCKRPKR